MRQPSLYLTVTAGFLLVAMGLLANEWFLTDILSNDGVIADRDRYLIRLFDVAALTAGAMAIRYRRAIAPRLGRLFVYAAIYLVFPAVCFTAADVYLGYRDLVSARNGVEIDSILAPDASLGWKPVAGKSGRHRSAANFDVVYHIDDSGCRRTPESAAGDRTIFIFGDSYTFGHGVSDDQAFPSLMARDYLAGNVRVVNAGVTGYGIIQMVQRFNEMKDRFRPGDLVLFTPIATDIRRNAADFVFVGQFIFSLDDIRVTHFPGFENGAIVSRRFDTPVNKIKALLLYARTSGRFYQLGYRLLPKPDMPAASAALLRTAASDARKNEVGFALIFLPVSGECQLGRYYEDVSAFPRLDIMEAFPCTPSGLAAITFPGDDHWNAAGHRITAAAVTRALVDNGLLPADSVRLPAIPPEKIDEKIEFRSPEQPADR